MRLVDFYIDVLLKTRQLVPMFSAESEQDINDIKNSLTVLLDQSREKVIAKGLSENQAISALFPVVSYVDEMILTSNWCNKSKWQQNSLQRHYFDTTNAGREFFERLNKLNREGEDRSIREVFLLCLGLGYKGQYFMPDDRPKLAEIRIFNLDLLLPEDANQTLEKTRLFDQAYQATVHQGRQATSRTNLIPFFTAAPILVIVGVFVFYSLQISEWLAQIMGLVK
ncbi:MAG: type VI secretion system protein ImpK [Gammaproteobacteria bacterium]|jgi:type VI secretion system protein ImpK